VNLDPEGRDLAGEVVPVRIRQALPHSLRGELVEDARRSTGSAA
jgi:hypothetical protein